MVDRNYIKILTIFLSVMVVNILYGFVVINFLNSKDPLQTKLNINDLDGWSMTHFILFLFLGYFFPTYYIFILSIGVLWEVFEYFYGKYQSYIPINTDSFKNAFARNGPPEWWYAKISDIFMNIAGFVIGAFLSYKFKKV